MKKKNILVTFLAIIIVCLIGILVYSNFFANTEEESKSNSPNNDNNIEEENKLLKEHSFEDLTMNNVVISNKGNTYTITFDFKALKDYAMLDLGICLMDKTGNILFVVPIHLENVVANEERKVEYSFDNIDVSSTYDYIFTKSEGEGVGI